jgi:hypothetical protein
VNAKQVRTGDSRISAAAHLRVAAVDENGRRTGLMIFNAWLLDLRPQRSPNLMQILETRYPTYLSPPPVDDARPNDTTWTVTRKWIDARRAGQKPRSSADPDRSQAQPGR